MAGTRRGPDGSGLPVKAQTRKTARQNTLRARLKTWQTPRGQVSAWCQHLRSLLADPNLPPEVAEQAAQQAATYMRALSDQLEKAITGTRR